MGKIVTAVFCLASHSVPFLLMPGCVHDSLLNSVTHNVYIDYIGKLNKVNIILFFPQKVINLI